MSINGGEEIEIEVPKAFSGRALLELLKPVTKKRQPQAQIVRGQGLVGSAEIKGGVAVHRPRNGNAGGVRRGETDFSLVGQRPRRPDNVREVDVNP